MMNFGRQSVGIGERDRGPGAGVRALAVAVALAILVLLAPTATGNRAQLAQDAPTPPPPAEPTPGTTGDPDPANPPNPASAPGAPPQSTIDNRQSPIPEAPGGLGIIIPIDGEISNVTAASLTRRVDEARQRNARVIVFDLDTPGGMVTSTLDITHMIRNVTDMKTVAWINPQAYSAGAIIALACNEIVMSRSSTMGDSQVILGGPTGAQAVPKELEPKILTPVLAELRDSARLNGYDPTLCEAFALPQLEVWWLENTDTRQREFVLREEKIKRISDEGQSTQRRGVSAVARSLLGSDKPLWKVIDSFHDIVQQKDVPLQQPVVRSDRLLQMSCSEAHAFGFNKAMVSNEAELKARYGLTELQRLESSWSENLAGWLTSMYVRAFLLIVIFLAAYVEFNTPGVGVAGLVALICLAIFVGAPYLTGLANIWEIVLIILGVVLIAVEVFVLPGFGVAGILGILMVLVGVLATFVPEEPGRSFPLFLPEWPGTVEWIKQGIIALVSALAASLAGMVVLSKLLPQTAAFRRLAPANPTPSQVMVEDPYQGAARVGDLGVAEGPLRPAGKARFGSVLVDVVSEGDFIEPGAQVQVVVRRGNHVVVRPVA
ncbi:MAG TPA: NfeD family protein [Phycisphaerae bacterium]|nr:NfeD family protein [Phycisphaerae bacterium]HNU45092.1 NfeD family protein [Phycisphaerae bacterium]